MLSPAGAFPSSSVETLQNRPNNMQLSAGELFKPLPAQYCLANAIASYQCRGLHGDVQSLSEGNLQFNKRAPNTLNIPAGRRWEHSAVRALAGRLLVPAQNLRLGRAVMGQRTCWTLYPLPTAPSPISGLTLSSGVPSKNLDARPLVSGILINLMWQVLGVHRRSACPSCLRVFPAVQRQTLFIIALCTGCHPLHVQHAVSLQR